MTSTYQIISVLLLAILCGGCYSPSGHSVISKTKELCQNGYKYLIIEKVPVGKFKALVFTNLEDESSLSDSHSIVRVYYKLTRTNLEYDAEQNIWVDKVHYELYGVDKRTKVATVEGFASKSPPEYGTDPVITSCGINTLEFYQALVIH